MILTNDIIIQGASSKGGYTKKQLELIGVNWPPPKGWKKLVLEKDFPEEIIQQFLTLGSSRHR